MDLLTTLLTDNKLIVFFDFLTLYLQ